MKRKTNYKSTFLTIGKIACAFLCIYLFLNILFFDTYSVFNYMESKERLNKLSMSNDMITNQNKQLEIENDRLKNDPHFIERIARHQFSMIKEGETVYIFRKN